MIELNFNMYNGYGAPADSQRRARAATRELAAALTPEQAIKYGLRLIPTMLELGDLESARVVFKAEGVGVKPDLEQRYRQMLAATKSGTVNCDVYVQVQPPPP